MEDFDLKDFSPKELLSMFIGRLEYISGGFVSELRSFCAEPSVQQILKAYVSLVGEEEAFNAILTYVMKDDILVRDLLQQYLTAIHLVEREA